MCGLQQYIVASMANSTLLVIQKYVGSYFINDTKTAESVWSLHADKFVCGSQVGTAYSP
jgi:hypothetical protein